MAFDLFHLAQPHQKRGLTLADIIGAVGGAVGGAGQGFANYAQGAQEGQQNRAIAKYLVEGGQPQGGVQPQGGGAPVTQQYFGGGTPASPSTGGGGTGQSSLAGQIGDYAKSIGGVESGGAKNAYQTLGPVTKTGDRAYGKYQVMGANIPQWTEQVLGRRMTPQEFLANPEAQDKVFNGIFGGYVSKYGNPQDAASAWFTGKPLAQAHGRRDQLGTTADAYVDKFNRGLPSGGGAPPNAMVAPQGGATPGAAPTQQAAAQPQQGLDIHQEFQKFAQSSGLPPAQAAQVFQQHIMPMLQKQSQMEAKAQELQMREQSLGIAQSRLTETQQRDEEMKRHHQVLEEAGAQTRQMRSDHFGAQEKLWDAQIEKLKSAAGKGPDQAKYVNAVIGDMQKYVVSQRSMLSQYEQAVNAARNPAEVQAIYGDPTDYVKRIQATEARIEELRKSVAPPPAAAPPQAPPAAPPAPKRTYGGTQEGTPSLKKDDSVLGKARKAIRDGAPKDAVIKRLKDQGYDPSGL